MAVDVEKRAESIRAQNERNRHEGDWKAWQDDGVPIVGWMPWRQDFRPVPLLTAESARDARLLVSVLNATEMRLPEGHVFEREDCDVVTARLRVKRVNGPEAGTDLLTAAISDALVGREVRFTVPGEGGAFSSARYEVIA
jgi:hypothetical protein